MKYTYPCRDCTQRAVGCHAACERYLEAKAAANAAKAEFYRRTAVDAYRTRTINKIKTVRVREKMKNR